MNRATDSLVAYLSFPFTLSATHRGASQPYHADSPAKGAYVDALAAEVRALDPDVCAREVAAVRLGGGASIMNADKVCALVRTVRRTIALARGAEVSIDVDPLTVGTPSLTDWTSCGITRVNLMVHSVLDDELAALGASHRRDDVQNALQFLAKFHVSNVSAHLTFGLPGQTSASWRKSLLAMADMGCAHVRVAPLAAGPCADGLPSADDRRALYELAIAELESHGYRQYAVDSFVLAAAPHARDRFAALQRAGAGRLGLGLGAASVYDGFRYQTTTLFDDYVTHAGRFELIVRNPVRESRDAFAVRLMRGALDALEPFDPSDLVAAEEGCVRIDDATAWLDGLVREGFAERGADGLVRLTDAGRFARMEELGRETLF